MIAQAAGDDLAAGEVTEVADVVVPGNRGGVTRPGEVRQPVGVADGGRQRLEIPAPPRSQQVVEVLVEAGGPLEAGVRDGGAHGSAGDGPHGVFEGPVDEAELPREGAHRADVEFPVE